MKKQYISPSIVVEATVLTTVMETISAASLDFGDGIGGIGDGTFVIYSKPDGLGYWDDEEDED